MGSITQPLRVEHKELLPHVETLRLAAEAVGPTTVEAFHQHLDAAFEFLTGHLIPHAKAEDAALYPVVGRVLGAPEATRTMSRDHLEVLALTDELATLRAGLGAGAPDEETANGCRRVLFGLYTLVKVHFAKEEEVYLPILDARLSETDAAAMFESMERAAAQFKAEALALPRTAPHQAVA